MSEQSNNLGSYQYGSEVKIYERVIFDHRLILLLFFTIASSFLAWQASKIKPDTSFLKMIPTEHPFIQNMIENLDDLGAAGTVIQVAVESKSGDIFTKEYMESLKQISDEVFYLPGVDRRGLESIWTPNVRWIAVTEEGFEGGPVIPDGYDGSEEKLEQLRQNILRSGRVGSLISDNFESSIVQATLFDRDPDTGEQLDYAEFSRQLEDKVRNQFQSDDIEIHIIGVAKLIGDLTEGGKVIVFFFLIAFIITAILLYWYSRCLISTFTPLVCSTIAVIWQLGLINFFGYGLSAYSMLVPFLVFAIGVSHGIQVVNAIAIELAEGVDTKQAARLAFRSLYVAGMAALISDGLGFLTLLIIDIEAIRELTIAASTGVLVVILTNLVLLPILMSFFGVTKSGMRHINSKSQQRPVIWEKLSYFAHPKVAMVSVIIAICGFGLGYIGGKDLKIGDLDEGAPELRPDSRYNLDNKYISDNYTVSSDMFVIMIKTPSQMCSTYENVEAIDRFAWHMENVEGVQSAVSMAFVMRQVLTGYNEGNLKWDAIPRDQRAIDSTFFQVPEQLVNTECSFAPMVLFLADHKAETLERVVDAAEAFIEANPMPNLEFQLATGNAGIEAATNQEIEKAQTRMLWLVYTVVSIFVFISFNSLSAVACIIIPLTLTSALSQALMAKLGIGTKVATLPVIGLGVGLGVDYGIYIYNRLAFYLRQGMPLQEAYFNTLKTTGKAVVLTGLALAIGVATWIWSPIKFQADMGLLLTFMFIWNMVGSIWLLPALAHFLIKPEKLVAKEEKKAAAA